MDANRHTSRKKVVLWICLLGTFMLSAAPAQAQDPPQQGTVVDQGAVVDTAAAAADLLRTGVDDTQLKPGEFLWLPAAQRAIGGPLVIIVNLNGQRAYVYRDGEPIAITTVSTGRPGRETPTGTFEILAKERMHHSNIYDDAPMPFMQRLTWSGLSLHAGHLPGYPASHGCVRLPEKFAQQLFDLTETGETVVISENGSAEALAHAGLDTQIDSLANNASTLHAIVVAAAPAVDSTAGDGATRAIAKDTDGAYSDAP
jgi:hypothetical protein